MKTACIALLTFLLGGCAVPARHPALNGDRLPPLIPVREFVADRQANGGHRLSPDGRKIAWQAVDGFRPAVFVQSFGEKASTAHPLRPVDLRWSADSRYLALVVDDDGDENTRIWRIDTETPGAAPVALSPDDAAIRHLIGAVDGTARVVVASNRRDPKSFDPLLLDLATGEETPLAQNPGDVTQWLVDRRGRLLARVQQAEGRRRLQTPSAAGAAWATIAEWGAFDKVELLEPGLDGRSVWALSNQERDTIALVRIDLASGARSVVREAGVDLEHVRLSRRVDGPLLVASNPDYPVTEIGDPALDRAVRGLLGGAPAAVYLGSADDAETAFTLHIVTDRGIRRYLYRDGGATLLGEDSLSRSTVALADVKPIRFKSRDGLDLHGYLTLPPGVKPEKLPLVLQVHGGPWWRDTWAQHHAQGPRFLQFLANRGYAVLQINYRGSTGYGRRFVDASIHEWSGRMHDDLIDGVQWAIGSGIADPERVAISGASYGGYAALVGLTFTPEVFACGIDFVGPSDLELLVDTAPQHWALSKPWFDRYLGDPSKAEDRARLRAQSPLHRAEAVARPLLVLQGANDVRVKQEQSDRMVAALRKAGKPVEYVVFDGEGHGNRHWKNDLALYRATEDFLARCLGGRSNGFDFYQLGAWAF